MARPVSGNILYYTSMNEEDTTQTEDPAEENGTPEADVEETSGGEQDVLPETPDLPTEIPPMPSVSPPKGNRYTPRGGPR